MFAYCNNNPVNSVDNNGLKPGDMFKTPQDAAEDFGRTYNEDSINEKREYGAIIYLVTYKRIETGEILLFGKFSILYSYEVTDFYYTYFEPTKGTKSSVTPSPWYTLAGFSPVSSVHTHSNYDPHYIGEEFSPEDKWWSEFFGVDSYLATPGGSLKKYNVEDGTTIVIYTDLPRDPNCP